VKISFDAARTTVRPAACGILAVCNPTGVAAGPALPETLAESLPTVERELGYPENP
jgi:hypothetical protein